MPVQLLTEIKIANARKQDFARAISYSMKKSKRTAWNMTRALKLSGGITTNHVDTIYGADAFTPKGTLTKESANALASQIKKTLRFQKKNSDVNLMEFAKAFIKENTTI